MRRLAVLLAVLVALVPVVPALATGPAPAVVTYRPPVDAPVVDAFRPPPENWNAGNRGIEYATRPGTPVAASADGEVVFSGPIAGEYYVVLLHDDGIRTSYSYLAATSVARGDKVRRGQVIGTTGERFQFGARAGDAYIDPALLFGGGPVEVHLVPDEVRRPQSEPVERAGLLRGLANLGSRAISGGAAALDWARDRTVAAVGQTVANALDEARGAVHYAEENTPSRHLERFVQAAYSWWKARATCTPDTVPAPKLQERHILVRVAGLGSTSENAAVDDVDATALGYAKADDVRFSYRGGTTAENPYKVGDTTNDIRQSARLLRNLLVRIQAENPGVPVDVIAHSQGGLVARSALTDEGDGADGRLPKINSLVTLATPHQGTPVATGLTMVGHTTVGQVTMAGVHAALPDKIDPAGMSVTQMAEESEFLQGLNRRPLPAGLKVTSIGAREDLAAPAGTTLLPGANNVTVSAPGHFNDHGNLPGSPEAQREIALGVAGLTPTCQSFGDAMADAAVSGFIYAGESTIGEAAWIGSRLLDDKVDETLPSPTVPRRYDS
ncbi:MAG: peptidoglycan DD-metalloendopeptidase family protein [Actinomycetota bacterium]|nr:peptidoglycan DD-metalloendopeptidase family protein [Actinomycetota bacterium]